LGHENSSSCRPLFLCDTHRIIRASEGLGPGQSTGSTMRSCLASCKLSINEKCAHGNVLQSRGGFPIIPRISESREFSEPCSRSNSR
jgi:hypothetical protein